MNGSERLPVLLVCGSLPPMRCGVADYTAGLARSLSARGGAKVAVLTSVRSGAPQLAGVDVLQPITHWGLTSLRPALEAIRAWKPAVVHVQYPSQGYDGTLPFVLGTAVSSRLRLPVVATLHEPAGLNRDLPGVALLARSAHAIVVVRPNFAELLPRGLKWIIAGKRVCFIPNATTLPKIERDADRASAIAQRYGVTDKALVAYFGFIYPSRGVDQLFRIANPSQHHLLIVGGKLDEAAQYHDHVTALTRESPWLGASTMVGFLPEEQAAEVLACADAVVLPFVGGGGVWNTSIHGARLQGTFVLTTSKERQGYDPSQNVFYARPGDIAQMRGALIKHLGTRQTPDDVPTWEDVTATHVKLYEQLRADQRF